MVNICADKTFQPRRHLCSSTDKHVARIAIMITILQRASAHSTKCYAPWLLGPTLIPPLFSLPDSSFGEPPYI